MRCYVILGQLGRIKPSDAAAARPRPASHGPITQRLPPHFLFPPFLCRLPSLNAEAIDKHVSIVALIHCYVILYKEMIKVGLLPFCDKIAYHENPSGLFTRCQVHKIAVYGSRKLTFRRQLLAPCRRHRPNKEVLCSFCKVASQRD